MAEETQAAVPDETVEQTLGQRRVRASFNPSESSIVDQIKGKSAELIDLLEATRNQDPEKNRHISLAQTSHEEAAMWAVKSVTS